MSVNFTSSNIVTVIVETIIASTVSSYSEFGSLESHEKSQNGRTTVSGGCVVYSLNVTLKIKDYSFQINRLLQTEVKRQKIQAKKEKNVNCVALQRQMESSQQRQTRLQHFSARKTICSQLETLEKSVIIILFFNLLTLVIFMKEDNISSHC